MTSHLIPTTESLLLVETDRSSWFRRPAVRLGVVLAILLIVVLVWPLWLPDPLAQDVANRLQPPSSQHPFGTDTFGRDVLSRVVSGARISISIGIAAAACALVIGGSFGAAAALAGRRTQAGMMRLTDILLAFPGPLLAIVLAVAIGPGFTTVVIVISIVYAAPIARLVRGLVVEELKQDYVTSALLIGSTRTRVLFRHVIINMAGPVLVFLMSIAADAILIEAGLSYLGAGVSPPTPAWGAMIEEGQQFIISGQWWLSLFPGIAIALTVLAFNSLADSIGREIRGGTNS
ncbi:UNVERIFIED_CONTAM: ABC transporter permease [Microbacterium sp. SLM126]